MTAVEFVNPDALADQFVEQRLVRDGTQIAKGFAIEGQNRGEFVRHIFRRKLAVQVGGE